MTAPHTAPLVGFLAITCCLSSQPAWSAGQTGEADDIIVVRDDLQELDSRGRYTTSGDVRWHRGQLDLFEGAAVGMSEEVGARCKLGLQLTLPPLVEEGEMWAGRIAFSYKDTGSELVVHLRRKQQGDRVTTVIRIISDDGSGIASHQKQIRQLELDKDLPSGNWLFHHHFGLLAISVDATELVAGYHDSRNAAISAWTFSMERGRATIGSVERQRRHRPEFSQEQETQLSRADELSQQVETAKSQGRFPEAAQTLQQVLEIRQQVQGTSHYDYLECLANLALLYTQSRLFDEAHQLYATALPVLERELGSTHPEFATVLNNVGYLHSETGSHKTAEKYYLQALAIRRARLIENHMNIVVSLSNLAELYRTTGQFEKAREYHAELVGAGRQLFGDDDPNYAILLNNLAIFYADVGEYTNAERTWNEVLAIRSRLLPPGHPYLAMTYASMGEFFRSTGEYAKATELLNKAEPLVKASLGEQHYLYTVLLNNQALLYHETGELAKSFAINQRVLELRKQHLSPGHPALAATLQALAMLHADMGDFPSAVAACQQALDIATKGLGPEHPNTLTVMSNLALIYHSMGRMADSLKMNEEVLAIRKRVLGEQHPMYALSQHNLAELYRLAGQLEKAELLYTEALTIVKETQGAEHPYYFACLNNLALLRESQGKIDESARLLQDVVDGRRKILGGNHPHYAISVVNLARLYRRQRQEREAESLLREALRIDRNLLDETALVQSERQQLAMGQQLRHHLDEYISLQREREAAGQAVFAQVLAWKGATLVRQRQVRTIGDEVALEPLFKELQQVTRRLAALAWFQSDPGEKLGWREEIATLTARKEALEARLMNESAAFRDLKKTVSIQDVLAALPSEAVLVDFLEYNHSLPATDPERPWQLQRRLLALVVRHQQPIVPVDLGAVDAIDAAIGTWRTSFGTSADAARAGQELRNAVWLPIEEHLRGASTVLISPDGVLGRLPLAALPGSKAGSYLIEEYRIAYIPVPQLLPALVRQLGRRQLKKNLLLMGDIDYGQSPQATPASMRTAQRSPFEPLPGTAKEIEMIEQAYAGSNPDGEVVLLRGKEATEQRFRQAVSDCDTVHVATHAFFEQRSETAAEDRAAGQRAAQFLGFRELPLSGSVGLRTGMVFAGANAMNAADPDDGILTAAEMMALQLEGVSLMTLSACETGLGRVASGEGLIGIQRACQAAGVKSTLASLWKVDDLATQRLMGRFYENRWKEGLNDLDALREAQIWMLRNPLAIQGLERGQIVQRKVQPAEPTTAQNSASPEFWAAFVLSGDVPPADGAR